TRLEAPEIARVHDAPALNVDLQAGGVHGGDGAVGGDVDIGVGDDRAGQIDGARLGDGDVDAVEGHAVVDAAAGGLAHPVGAHDRQSCGIRPIEQRRWDRRPAEEDVIDPRCQIGGVIVLEDAVEL